MSSAICFNLDQSKILSSGNGLKGKEGSVEQLYIWPSGQTDDVVQAKRTRIRRLVPVRTITESGFVLHEILRFKPVLLLQIFLLR